MPRGHTTVVSVCLGSRVWEVIQVGRPRPGCRRDHPTTGRITGSSWVEAHRTPGVCGRLRVEPPCRRPAPGLLSRKTLEGRLRLFLQDTSPQTLKTSRVGGGRQSLPGRTPTGCTTDATSDRVDHRQGPFGRDRRRRVMTKGRRETRGP